ncbi:HD-GYP domain-containing protein [Sporomusa termitida]|uniref:HDIG: HDIG domain protein n=1 Tax=Sporomusa termitida TaxID=2377 RepID=A0A517DR86_9FIRM|nr:HD domain-containing phosphohydrolase [Sporomusa termitida]QDR79786.1 HDIG: HDIG domain protein [Sporomusa termitida]
MGKIIRATQWRFRLVSFKLMKIALGCLLFTRKERCTLNHKNPIEVIGYSAHNIFDKFGRLLLAKGAPLNRLLIQRLERRKIFFQMVPQKGAGNHAATHLSLGIQDTRFQVPGQLDKKFERFDTEAVALASKYLNLLLADLMEDPFLSNNLKILAHGRRATYSHSINVALLSITIAQKLSLANAKLRELALGALYHDLGKMLLPKSVLDENETLCEGQCELYQQHTQLGSELLAADKLPKSIYLVALQHHEKYDGNGYLYGLAGDKIHFNAAIVAVADAFDHFTTAALQNPVLAVDEALHKIFTSKGIDYHPLVVEQLEKLFIKLSLPS